MGKQKFSADEGYASSLDKTDPLASFRERFYIPENKIYMDGNSLGPMCKEAGASLERVTREWRQQGIDGWIDADTPWFHFAEKLGARMAPLMGAAAEEVVCSASTTVNIHALVASFYQPRGKRDKILADALNFPSDIYALKSHLQLRGADPAENLVLADSEDGRTLDMDRLVALMDDGVALALFSSVLYRSGQLLDVAYLTRKAHERGIVIGFDCSHSAGALPHRFDDWGVDFAMWCSYKYLNGGPGSPAFIYVNQKHLHRQPLLAGWFGCDKNRQFEMSLDFHRAPGVGAWQISTPVMLGCAPLEGSLDLFHRAGIDKIREKSLALTDYLMCLVEAELSAPPYGFRIGTPRGANLRGGHVALERDKDAWAVCRALKAAGVIPDYRPPNVIRIAPVALYNTFHEVWRVVQVIKDIIDGDKHLAYVGGQTQVT